MSYRLFADCHCSLSEAPMWNKKEQMLYWRGSEGEIYRKPYDNNPQSFECFQLNIGRIGSIVFTDSDYMLLFADYGKVWKWTVGNEPTLLYDFKKNLFNDCIIDSKGRIYCGMLSENFFDIEKRGKYGSFWRLDPDGSFNLIEDKIGAVPNGIRFSPDLKKLYFGVTDTDVIYSYDYDLKTGKLSNRTPLITGCIPDGITVDKNGNIWVANCGLHNPVECYSPDGKLLNQYHLPVRRPISVAFGGNDNKTLFISTAHENDPVGDHDGGIFCIETDVEGCDEYILNTK